VTTFLLNLLRNYLSTQVIALLFLLPVVLSTRLWGLGAGILSATCAFLSLNYFFLLPYYTLVVHHTQDLLALIVFLIVAVVISQLLGRAQESIASAVSREREATHLYDLSLSLAGLHDEKSIAQVLAEKIQDSFETERVEIVLPGRSGAAPIVYSLPIAAPAERIKPDLTVPLLTARGKQGEAHLWRKLPPLSFSEQRLLSTYTSQGALAVERAALAQSETRSKVLEESDRLKSALLSSVSHELRSPLATIKASISSLHSGTIDWDSEARQELLSAIEEETDYLNQLVGNLLDMTRIETGALNPQRKWNSLSEIVNGVLARSGMRQSILQHKIEVDIPPETPLVPVDYLLIEQVFANLISNSVKYAPPHTLISIKARLQTDQTVLIEVSNQGPPVPEEHLERIFDKFYRVTAADKITGTGLGLSICKGIVEAHGGRIWAENAPGRFIFKFTLPVTWQGERPHFPEDK
jgi:two-component system sensor histidine kinase KdpD